MAQQGAAMGESVVFVDGRGVGLQLPRVLFKNEIIKALVPDSVKS